MDKTIVNHTLNESVNVQDLAKVSYWIDRCLSSGCPSTRQMYIDKLTDLLPDTWDLKLHVITGPCKFPWSTLRPDGSREH
jgi:hypothetical protein